MKESLVKLSADINEKFGKGAACVASDIRFPKIPRTPSGIFNLDLALGGGWPRSRMNHLWGAQSVGKTTITLHAIAQAQKRCHWCSHLLERCSCGAKDPISAIWFDIERTFDAEWAKKIGVNFDYFVVANPEYGELAIDMIDRAIRSGDVGIVVVDSVAALTFSQQIEKSAEESEQPGLLAKHMTRGLKKWTAALNVKLSHPSQKVEWDNLCSVFLLNQVRDVLNSRYPMPPGPPAGRALRHYASTEVSLNTQNDGYVWEGEEGDQSAVSQLIKFKTEKNKTFAPKRTGSFRLVFSDACIDNEWQIYQHSIKFDIVHKAASWFTYTDGKKTMKIQGEDKMLIELKKEGQFVKIATEVCKRLEPST